MEVHRVDARHLLVARTEHQSECINNRGFACIVLTNESGKSRR